MVIKCSTFNWHKQINVESVRIMVLEIGKGFRILQDKENKQTNKKIAN